MGTFLVESGVSINMKVPFLDLKRQYENIKNEIEPVILECAANCGYIEGKEVKALEESMAEYLQVKHVITCGCGTDALKIALKACGVNPGDEVITTAFSFFATAEAISAVSATPVFIDINRDDFNIDVGLIEEKITAKTKAILPVHIFGRPANIEAIHAIAEKHNLKVIEDACQAIGSSKNGKKVGCMGDVAGFSFYPTKNLGCFGDGGMITTNDDEIAMISRALKAHAGGKNGFLAAKALGMDVGQFVEENQKETELYDPYKYYNFLIGDNSRLDSLQAAILNVKLNHLDDYNDSRTRIAQNYNAELSKLPIQLPSSLEADTVPCWHQYAILTEEKEALINFLGEQGIGAGSFYPVPLHLQKAFYSLGYQVGDIPNAERICSQSVCLPIFPELTEEEQDYVIDTIRKFYK